MHAPIVVLQIGPTSDVAQSELPAHGEHTPAEHLPVMHTMSLAHAVQTPLTQ